MTRRLDSFLRDKWTADQKRRKIKIKKPNDSVPLLPLSKRIDSSTDFLSQFLLFERHGAEMRTIVINWLTDNPFSRPDHHHRRRRLFSYFAVVCRSSDVRQGRRPNPVGRASNIRGFHVHGLRSRRQLFLFLPRSISSPCCSIRASIPPFFFFFLMTQF